MALGGEGTVSNLGGLEGNNHVGGRSKHGQVTGNGGREGHLHPVVGSGIWEGGGKHLYHRDVGGNIGKDGDDKDEPVHTWNSRHLLGTSAHGKAEECLGNTGIVEGSNQDELTNEKHEKTVVNLGKCSLGLGDKLLILGLNLVTVHVVHLLGWEGVALGIILDHFRLGVIVLSLPCSQNHEDGSSTDRGNTDIKSNGKANKEDGNKDNLDLGPD